MTIQGMMKYALYVCCFMLCVSCVGLQANIEVTPINTLTPLSDEELNYLFEHPSPLPDYLHNLRYGVDRQKDEIVCTDIVHKPIWVEGTFTQDTNKAIKDSLVIWIDGQPNDKIVMQASLFVMSNGAGSIGTVIVCAIVTGISEGLHSAQLEFQNIAGNLYSYQWIFKVDK
jgi:hypothetical protein